MYPGYLPECMICFTFWALHGVYNIENALLVCPYPPVLFAAVAEPSLAKEVFALVKSDADVNLKPCFDGYFLRKYYVHHFVFDLRLREILVFLGPCFCAYFYFIEAFEVLRQTVSAQNLIHTKSGKLNILFWYKADRIVRFLVRNIT